MKHLDAALAALVTAGAIPRPRLEAAAADLKAGRQHGDAAHAALIIESLKLAKAPDPVATARAAPVVDPTLAATVRGNLPRLVVDADRAIGLGDYAAAARSARVAMHAARSAGLEAELPAHITALGNAPLRDGDVG